MEKLYVIRNLACSYDKHYTKGRSKVVLDIRSLDIPKGKMIFIVGESGIGKSTILEVLGMMNNTTVPGENMSFFFFEERNRKVDLLELWNSGSDKLLSEFRLKHFNFIFQSTNLMRNFTAYENVALTRMLQGYSAQEAYDKTAEVLEDLGLPQIGRSRMVQELSGGQQQRLAFARALLPDFSVLFGDEPTGNLDVDNAFRAMELLSREMNNRPGTTAIIVTHDMHLATHFAHQIIKIRKEFRAAEHEADDASYYGYIDETCTFSCDADHKLWSNGSKEFETEEFVNYLKNTAQV